MIRLLTLLGCLCLTGCISFSGCKGDVCIEGTSFLRPLAEVTFEVPRSDDEGVIKGKITYAKDQVSLQAATELVRAARPE